MFRLPSKRVPPPWLEAACRDAHARSQRGETRASLSCFLDTQKFQDEIDGEIYLNQMERDLVDTPEFQRLFRISQLGFVDLVWHTANHTRAAHSIACCALSKDLAHAVNDNTVRVDDERQKYLRMVDADRVSPIRDNVVMPPISFASQVLISAAALLHDVTHGPFSHDIEKKTHRLDTANPRTKVRSFYGAFPKHDDYSSHAALYVMLLDHQRSVLARALRAYSPLFWMLLETEIHWHPELQPLVETARADWIRNEDGATDLLPKLLFHLLVFEKPDEVPETGELQVATRFEKDSIKTWALGPDDATSDVRQRIHRAWYQPYRHDIVGNTLSADLIDYLLRDTRRFGLAREPDLRLADYLVVAPVPRSTVTSPQTTSTPVSTTAIGDGPLLRCVLDLNDYKRGTVRYDVVNELFRLLELRFEIHEKAVFHRVVQAAAGMLAREIFLRDQKIPLASLFGYSGVDGESSPALCSEDLFLQKLVAESSKPTNQCIAQKIAERRVYRPLMVIPGDRVDDLLRGLEHETQRDRFERDLRALAAIIDSERYAPFFCFISWCIEQLLQHTFESEAELREFIRDVCSDASQIGDILAYKAKPKRVIFWTLPFKQLHKDPAVLARFTPQMDGGDIVDTLEGLARQPPSGHADQQSWPSLRARIEAGIHNASRQYESLWKLFVYVSDGLYYTGVLSKIIPGHPCSGTGGVSSHEGHLKTARGLCVETLRAAWKDWIDLRSRIGDEAGASHLNAAADTNLVHRLLQWIYQPTQEGATDIADRVSLVAVHQYLHAEVPGDAVFPAPPFCRDTRYKFGSVALELAPLLTSSRLPAQMHEWALRVLAYIGVRSDGKWAADEVDECLSHLRPILERAFSMEVEADVAAATLTANTALLRSAWRGASGWEGNFDEAIAATTGQSRAREVLPFRHEGTGLSLRPDVTVTGQPTKKAARTPPPELAPPLTRVAAQPSLSDEEVFELKFGSRNSKRRKDLFDSVRQFAAEHNLMPLHNEKMFRFLPWLRKKLGEEEWRNKVPTPEQLKNLYLEFERLEEGGFST